MDLKNLPIRVTDIDSFCSGARYLSLLTQIEVCYQAAQKLVIALMDGQTGFS